METDRPTKAFVDIRDVLRRLELLAPTEGTAANHLLSDPVNIDKISRVLCSLITPDCPNDKIPELLVRSTT